MADKKCPKCGRDMEESAWLCECGYNTLPNTFKKTHWWEEIGRNQKKPKTFIGRILNFIWNVICGIVGFFLIPIMGILPLIAFFLVLFLIGLLYNVYPHLPHFLIGAAVMGFAVLLAWLIRKNYIKTVLKYAGCILLYLLGMILLGLAVKYCWPILLIGVIVYTVYVSIKNKK